MTDMSATLEPARTFLIAFGACLDPGNCLAQNLFDETYWTRTQRRLVQGRLAPMIEAKLLAYAYGEPKQTIDVPQLADIAVQLAKKVVHEIHPGPTKDR